MNIITKPKTGATRQLSSAEAIALRLSPYDLRALELLSLGEGKRTPADFGDALGDPGPAYATYRFTKTREPGRVGNRVYAALQAQGLVETWTVTQNSYHPQRAKLTPLGSEVLAVAHAKARAA